MKRFARWLPLCVSLAVLGLAALVKAQQYPLIEQLQYQVFDAYQRQFPREYVDMGVRILDIDEASLAKLGQWPWPRTVMAQLVQRLSDAGVAVIGFDVVFAEPDRTSPAAITPHWPIDEVTKQKLAALPDHETLFAQALEAVWAVTGFVMTHEAQGAAPKRRFGMSFAGMEGSHPRDYLLSFSGATLNLPELEAAASASGFFNSTPSRDGMLRSVPLALALNDDIYFSLSMEMLRVAQGASNYIIKMAGASGEESYGSASGITHIRNGKFEIPTDANGNLLIHFTPYTRDRYISASELLNSEADLTNLEGKIVIVGTSAPGLLDLRATPLNPSLPGVELHVQALEQILSGHYLMRPDWILYAEMVLMVVVGLLLMLMMSRLTAVWGALFMVVAQGAALWFSVMMFQAYGYLIDPVGPGIVILLLYLTESLRRYMLSEAERKQVRGAFAQYMSPALVEELAKNPEKLVLGGEMRDLTVLFCDIRGFTTISEQYDAHGLTQFINDFLTPMSDVILARKGTIDKYMGDCIMAFWNAPLEVRDHAREACEAALAMFDALHAFNESRQKAADEAGLPFQPVAIGVGLNSGMICVGNMGSRQRFDYSVLGDEVNLASRLEGQSKTYGVGIVIGQNTQAQVPQLATLELDLIKVKGKTQAVTIYALLGGEALRDNGEFGKLCELWDKALHSYRAQQWDEAVNFMALARTQCGKVPMASLEVLFDLYAERIKRFRITLPPADWDGVFAAESK